MYCAKRHTFVIVILALFLIFGVTVHPALAQQESKTYVPFAAAGAVSPTSTALPGEASDPVTEAIPQLAFTARPEDYSDDHPDLGGLMISFNTLYLVFSLDTTVSEANAILNELDATIVGGIPGIADESEGILALRLPTTTHAAMMAALETLRGHPKVELAVQDSLLDSPEPLPGEQEVSTSSVSQPNGGLPSAWTWQVAPAGDNWGLELMRVPQLWNLNHAVTKQGTSAITGVLDSGFNNAHPDLLYLENLSADSQQDHGTHIAGTIGATFNNGVGIDGVNPFAHLVVMHRRQSFGWGLVDFMLAREDLQVVNISLGYGWSRQSPPITPNSNTTAQTLVKDQAKLLVYVQKLVASANGSLPFVLVSAGNDSAAGLGNIEARWNSPFTYAALGLGLENFMVVEAVQQTPGGAGGASRAPFSNVRNAGDENAAVSAPGVAIMSTFFSLPYNSISGTSMATPHVTGLVSYLLSLEPTLTHSELRQLLLANAVVVGGGASNRVDAYASALAIDTLRGNANILTKLLDIDDGSPDGNARILCAGCADYLGEDADSDGGRGDGSVDMADFRRWRDALLQVEASANLQLDGSANHPKKDLNGDGLTQGTAQENVYPLGDFNGDGILDRTAMTFVRGTVNAVASDLDVLRKLFTDPYYQASALAGLIDSADLEVNAQDCLALENVVEVRSQLLISGTTTLVEARTHTPAERIHIFTAAVNATGYTLKVTAHDSSGKVVGIAINDFSFTLGSDTYFTPVCGNIVLEPVIVEHKLNKGETVKETVRLVSNHLEANYVMTNVIAHVIPDPDQGKVEQDGEAEIELTFTCGDETGLFPDDLKLAFTDDDGHVLNEAVPQAIDIKLTCLQGGVTAIPNPIELTAAVEESVSSQFTLQNLGTALNYQATVTGVVALTGDAEGVLAEEGEVTIPLQATCPSTAGFYIGTVGLEFSREDGKPVAVVVPTAVAVYLTCTDDREIVIYRQSHQIGALIDYPATSRGEIYRSEDYLGTGEHHLVERSWEQDTITITPIAALGFGEVGMNAEVAGSFTYTESNEVKSRSANAIVSYTSMSAYTKPTATFMGTIASSISESGKMPTAPNAGPRDAAFGSSGITFELTTSATIEASWSCDGQFLRNIADIRLTRTTPDQPFVVIFAEGSVPECHYSGTLVPGRYVFVASTGVGYGDLIQTGGTSVSQEASYSLTITIIE